MNNTPNNSSNAIIESLNLPQSLQQRVQVPNFFIVQSHPSALPETRAAIAAIRVQALNHLHQSKERALYRGARVRSGSRGLHFSLAEAQHVFLPRGDQAFQQEQFAEAQPERFQNPTEAGTPVAAEELAHPGIGVEDSELVVESGAGGELVAEGGEPDDFAAEVASRRRRRELQGLCGDARDAATWRRRWYSRRRRRRRRRERRERFIE